MMLKKISLMDLEIITTISESEKTIVSLVSVKETGELAVLKKYAPNQSLESYEQIKGIESVFFPKVYHIWEENGAKFLLEEYVPGETLQEKINQNYLFAEVEITDIVRQICKALQVLHYATPPIIHRDVKPENVILMSDGSVKLIDFDAAREYKEEQDRDTVMMGTKEYASPEQFGFMQTDIRSDIYSWGIVFSELLGQANVNHRYTVRARKIIDRATMFDPEKRYSNTTVLLQNLERLSKRQNPLWLIIFAIMVVGIVLVLCQLKQTEVISGTTETQTESALQSENEMQTEPESQPESGIQTESPSREEVEWEMKETVSLKEIYTYSSVVNELREKSSIISATRNELFSFPAFEDNDDGMYSKYQECEIGNLYPTMRFLQAYPRDIALCDNELEDANIEWVYYRPYLEDEKKDGEKVVLSSEDYRQDFGNVFVFSKEFLQTMEPGMYTLYIDTNDKEYGVYLIVHGAEEEVDNFRVHINNNIAYYSEESQNEVVFYINSTPFPIKEIQMNDIILESTDYQLVDGGFGVVFQKPFFDKYNEMDNMPLVISTENGKKVMCRIINLSHF